MAPMDSEAEGWRQMEKLCFMENAKNYDIMLSDNQTAVEIRLWTMLMFILQIQRFFDFGLMQWQTGWGGDIGIWQISLD